MTRQRRKISLGDRVWDLEVERAGDRLEIWIDGQSHPFTVRSGPDGSIELRADAAETTTATRGYVARDGDLLWVHAGRTRCFAIEHADRKRAAGAVSDHVQAPMTGTVRRILVATGDAIEKGRPLLVLEAMKMEHVLRAPRDGVVAAIDAVEGSQAEAQAVLVRLEPASGSDAPAPPPSGGPSSSRS
ncbi:MAG: biotin/lipoyl-containing protein [Candidatus Eisenbacteria bacterium]